MRGIAHASCLFPLPFLMPHTRRASTRATWCGKWCCTAAHHSPRRPSPTHAPPCRLSAQHPSRSGPQVSKTCMVPWFLRLFTCWLGCASAAWWPRAWCTVVRGWASSTAGRTGVQDYFYCRNACIRERAAPVSHAPNGPLPCHGQHTGAHTMTTNNHGSSPCLTSAALLVILVMLWQRSDRECWQELFMTCALPHVITAPQCL